MTSQAVLIAIRVDWDGRRQILAVEMANRESRSSWKDFLLGLRRRGLNGVEFVVADDHAGLRVAIREVLPEAAFQRCYVHFLRNALDHLPRKADDDCLQELRWLYDRRSVEEARCDLAAWITKWGARRRIEFLLVTLGHGAEPRQQLRPQHHAKMRLHRHKIEFDRLDSHSERLGLPHGGDNRRLHRRVEPVSASQKETDAQLFAVASRRGGLGVATVRPSDPSNRRRVSATVRAMGPT